jgi:hypothetical protein
VAGVTSTLAGPSATASTEPAAQPQPGEGALSGLDLLAGGALLLVALLGWASLTLAHLGAHSLPAVTVLTLVAFAVVAGVGGLLARGAAYA